MNNADKICLFDMDGTLFDYEGQLRCDLKKIASPNDPDFDEIPLWHKAEEQPWLKARMDLIKSQIGWWRHLPVLTDGEWLLITAKEIGFHCKILTKGPNSKSFAWAEKVDAVMDHFKGVEIDIVGGESPENKTPKRGTYGRVLVDDYPDYMLGWLENRPRGLGIMPAQSYNADFEHPNVIRFDGTNKSLVKNALAAAFQRESGQSWQELMFPPGIYKGKKGA